MIELFLSVCLVSQADVCKDVRLTYTGKDFTPVQCIMGSEPEIVRRIEGDPKWTVKRWKCGRTGAAEKIV